jgi:multiple antibiotic resistance protein
MGSDPNVERKIGFLNMPPEITFLDLFLPIFIGIGLVKVLLEYMALTKNSSTALQRKVARKTILTGTIIAIVLLLAGAFIFRLLYFTAGALSIAGGLILLILALNIVLSPAENKEETGPVSEKALMSMAIYPLAIPSF